MQDQDTYQKLIFQQINSPISEVQGLIETGKGAAFHYPRVTEDSLMQSMDVEARPYLLIPPTQLAKIVDGVRNTVLNWALQLESDGIFGVDLVFSEGELSSAAQNVYNVNNFFGGVEQAQFQHGSTHSVQIMHIEEGANLEAVGNFLATLKEAIPELGLDGAQQSELDAEIRTAESQLQSPKPKRRIIKEALRSMYRIVSGAAKSALTAKLIAELSQLLQ